MLENALEEEKNFKKETDISHDFTRPNKLNKKEEKALNYENVKRLLEGK